VEHLDFQAHLEVMEHREHRVLKASQAIQDLLVNRAPPDCLVQLVHQDQLVQLDLLVPMDSLGPLVLPDQLVVADQLALRDQADLRELRDSQALKVTLASVVLKGQQVT